MSIPTTTNTFPPSVLTQPNSQDHEFEKALDLLYKKYKDRLTTLPNTKSWLTGNLYLYQGFWHESTSLISIGAVIASQESFKARPTDIYLATQPKCGTTWLKALAFATLNRTKYKTNSLSTHPLQTLNPHKLVPPIENEILRTSPTYADAHSPRLFSTHIPYTSLPESIISSGCRIVYMCRNPKDVLVSLFHFMNKIRDKDRPLMSFEEAFEMFSKGCSPCGPCWDHVKGYYKISLEQPNKIMFLTYEDMQMDPVNNLKRLAEFLGYPFTGEEEAEGVVKEIVELCSFEKLREVGKQGINAGQAVPDDAFFRQGKVGDWTNYLTSEMSKILDQITKQEFHGLNLSY